MILRTRCSRSSHFAAMSRSRNKLYSKRTHRNLIVQAIIEIFKRVPLLETLEFRDLTLGMGTSLNSLNEKSKDI